MRIIGIMIGSDSDLPQCRQGLKFLEEAEKKGLCKVALVITNSIHRNTDDTLQNVKQFSSCQGFSGVDVWIAGAGWANHLTGIVDSYLRYAMKNDRVRVIGVVFDAGDDQKNLAAFLSIEHVPGHQVIFDREKFFGPEGFLNACKLAAEGDLAFSGIVLKDPKPTKIRTLNEALMESEQK